MSNQLPQFQSKDKIKVLLIEDDQPTIDVYKMRFDVADFETIILKRGEEAIEWAKTCRIKPDIVILDLMLPGINGFEVLKEYKKIERISDVPVMVLTAFADSEREKRARQIGVTAYYVKTMLEPKDIVEKVKEIVGSKSKEY